MSIISFTPSIQFFLIIGIYERLNYELIELLIIVKCGDQLIMVAEGQWGQRMVLRMYVEASLQVMHNH